MYSPRTTIANLRVPTRYRGGIPDTAPRTVAADSAAAAKLAIAEAIGFRGERARIIARTIIVAPVTGQKGQ